MRYLSDPAVSCKVKYENVVYTAGSLGAVSAATLAMNAHQGCTIRGCGEKLWHAADR